MPRAVAAGTARLRAAVCRAIEEAAGADQQNRAWKLLYAMDALLYANVGGTGRRAAGAAPGAAGLGYGIKAQVAERLTLAWEGRWSSLWTLAAAREGSAGEPPPQDEARRRDAERVADLVSQGELSRAAAAVWGAGGGIPAEVTTEAFKETQKASAGAGAAAGVAMRGRSVPQGMREGLEARLAARWRRYPRHAGAGPAGDRYEHWGVLQADADSGRQVASTVARLATGDMPEEALRAYLACKLVGIPKKGKGVRVLGCGSALRRLVGQSVCKELAQDIAEGVGGHQYGVSRKDGANLMHKEISWAAAARPEQVVMAFDLSNAFPSVDRAAVQAAVRKHCPSLEPVAQAWYGGPSRHAVRGGGETLHVDQHQGLDQGCPLSPALFSLTLRDPLDALAGRLREQGDPDPRLWAYLDDIYVQVAPEHGAAVEQWLEQRMATYGLRLNRAKTQVWSPRGEATLPHGLAERRVTELTCLGPTVPYGRPDRDPESDPADRENLDGAVDLTCHQRADDGGFLERQRRYLGRLRELTERGLPWSAALQLLQTWTAGACVHLQRALPMAGEWTRQVDGQVMDFLGDFLGERPDALAQEQAFLPVRLGGLGLASAVARQDAAWVGAWEDNLHAVAEASGAASLEAMRAAWPQWWAALEAADARLATLQGTTLPAGRWAARAAEPAKRAQHAHTLKALDARHRDLLGKLVLGDKAALQAGSGPGAGAFLQGGAEGEHLGDAHLRVALRRRLRYRRPVPEPRAACQHKDASGRLCGGGPARGQREARARLHQGRRGDEAAQRGARRPGRLAHHPLRADGDPRAGGPPLGAAGHRGRAGGGSAGPGLHRPARADGLRGRGGGGEQRGPALRPRGPPRREPEGDGQAPPLPRGRAGGLRAGHPRRAGQGGRGLHAGGLRPPGPAGPGGRPGGGEAESERGPAAGRGGADPDGARGACSPQPAGRRRRPALGGRRQRQGGHGRAKRRAGGGRRDAPDGRAAGRAAAAPGQCRPPPPPRGSRRA